MCAGRYIAEGTAFATVSCMLASYKISKAVDAAGNEIPVELTWSNTMIRYVTPPTPQAPSSRLIGQSAGQGALSMTEITNAAQKCTMVGVPNAATVSLELRVRTLAIKVIATNIRPISAAAAEPAIT